MNEIEERLWSYIDGTCTPTEQQAISNLITHDAAYRSKYQELLLLNAELQQMGIDEPPMAFTYNVMEAIRTEHARQPLKATINKNIINVLSGFFITLIGALLIYILANIHLTGHQGDNDFAALTKVPDLKNYLTAPVLKAFIFLNMVLALALFDGYLRRRNYPKQV